MKAGYLFRGIALLIVAVFSLSFAWGQSVSVSTPTPSSPAVDGTFTVGVNFSGVTNLIGSHVVLSFDQTRIRYEGVTNGNVFPSTQAPFVNVGTGQITVDQAAFGSAFTGGTGTLFTVTFTAIQAGPVDISLPEVKLRDAGNNPVGPTSGTTRSVTVNPVINSSADVHGSISPLGRTVVPYGTDQNYTITADANYHVADVLVDGVSVGAVGSRTFTGVTANHTISASFAINTFTVSFNSNGGSSVSSITGVVYNTAVGTLPANPTKTGYTFGGWFTDDGTFANAFTAASIVTGDITVYAKWTVVQYTISFNSNGGTAVTSITQDFGTAVTAPTAPTRTGYTFAGWCSDIGLTTVYTFTTMPAENMTLYAKWTVVQYTISFNSNSGSSVTSITQDFGTAVTAPTAPTRTGYSFAGWYSDALLTTAYTFTTMPAENITLYAKWTVVQYMISFESNGGSAVTSITQDFGTAVTAPTAPTRTGYTFAGWYSDAGLTTAYTFTTMPAENITLYAKWTVNSYTLTVNSTTGGSITAPVSSPVTVNHGVSTTITAVADGGYNFTGWTVVTGTGVMIAAAGNLSTTAALTAGDATVRANFDPIRNLYVSKSPTPAAAGIIYPSTSWSKPTPPSGYPTGVTDDWGFTGTQELSVYLVLEAGMVFNTCSVMLQWDPEALTYTGSDFGATSNGLFGSFYPTAIASATPNGTNQVTIYGSRSGDNFTTTAGDYIAKVNFTLKKPGYCAISVVSQNFQRVSPPSPLAVATHEGKVRAYLGDVAGSDGNSGDGTIGPEDLTPWSLSYWSGVPNFSGGMTKYRIKYDIGPTANKYVYTLPDVDGRIDFEDLVIFSIMYGLSNAPGGLPRVPAPSKDPVAVSLGKPSVVGNEIRMPVMVAGGITDIRGMRLEVSGQFGQFLGAEKGGLLASYSTPVMVMSRAEGRQVYVDLAVMGLDAQAVARPGELVVLRFAGTPYVRLINTDLRNSANTALRVAMIKGEGELAPTTYQLSQNYPNPFNPTTTIEYALPQAGNVTLDVYNILGERVAQLVNEVQEAGVYQVRWDGKDMNKMQVASGVYLYRVHAGSFSSVKKMMLLK